jgi:uncharacterized coiled-coil protein SlyX
MADEEARSRISALEERSSEQERWLGRLETAQRRMEANLARMTDQVQAALPQLAGEVERLRALAPEREVEVMRQEAAADAPALRSAVDQLRDAAGIDSRVASDSPPLFDELSGKRSASAARNARRFRCSSLSRKHTDALLDTKWNVFGGFSICPESRGPEGRTTATNAMADSTAAFVWMNCLVCDLEDFNFSHSEIC